jgi:hypothetical protein
VGLTHSYLKGNKLMTIITSSPIPEVAKKDIVCYKTIIMYCHRKRGLYLSQCGEYIVTAGHLAGIRTLDDEMFNDNLLFNRYKIITEDGTDLREEDVYITDYGVQVYTSIPEDFGFDKRSNVPQRKIDNAILYKVIIPKGTKYYKSKITKYSKDLMLTAEKVIFVQPIIYGKGLSEERIDRAKQYIKQTKERYGQLPQVKKYYKTKETK